MVLKRPELACSSRDYCHMAFQHSVMTREDVRKCVELIVNNPVIAQRYGNSIGDLHGAWLKLLDYDAKTTTVIKAAERPGTPICFVGVSVIVRDDFLQELKTSPLRWVGPELATRLLRGKSPLLTKKELREYNSSGGLNLLVWEGCFSFQFEKDGEILRRAMDLFVETHRGFLWKEVIGSQHETGERLFWMFKTGALLWNPLKGRYLQSVEKDPNDIVRRPYLAGFTREIELQRSKSWSSSWAGAVFEYRAPKCGLSPGQQQMLMKALDGWTDQELSARLGKSLPTIRKMWRSVYERVADHVPELTLQKTEIGKVGTKRGPEKKRHLLGYVREHPEELRPFGEGTIRVSSSR
jgi:hypothetical protein